MVQELNFGSNYFLCQHVFPVSFAQLFQKRYICSCASHSLVPRYEHASRNWPEPWWAQYWKYRFQKRNTIYKRHSLMSRPGISRIGGSAQRWERAFCERAKLRPMAKSLKRTTNLWPTWYDYRMSYVFRSLDVSLYWPLFMLVVFGSLFTCLFLFVTYYG